MPCVPILSETVYEDYGWLGWAAGKMLPYKAKGRPPMEKPNLFAEKDTLISVRSLFFEGFPYDLPAQLTPSDRTEVTSATFSVFPTNKGVRSW